MATKKIKQNLPTLADDTDPKTFKKASSAVGMRVMRGPALTLIGRKAFNVLIWHAQKLGRPGVNAPEKWDGGKWDPAEYYWMPLGQLVQDTAWGSKDWSVIVETLQQLQQTLVVSDEPTGGLVSAQLLGVFRIRPASGRRPALLGWQFHSETADMLLDPEIYTWLSLYHLTNLQTPGGAALYEIGKRYVTFSERITARKPWTEWFDILTGVPAGSEEYPEYKYFKRDVLKRAIAEVNTTDIRIELVEHKVGRAVADLQFMVSHAPQGNLELPPAPLVNGKLLDRLEAFGLSHRESLDYLGREPEDHLIATAQLVEDRIANTKLDPLASPAAYFRSALKQRYVETTAKKPTPKKTTPALPKPEPKDNPELTARIDKALCRFDALPVDVQEALILKFKQEQPSHRALKPSGKVFRRIIALWLAEDDNRIADAMAIEA